MLIILLLFLPPAPTTKPVICIFPGFLKKTKYSLMTRVLYVINGKKKKKRILDGDNLNLCPRITILSLSLFFFVIGYSKPITLF